MYEHNIQKVIILVGHPIDLYLDDSVGKYNSDYLRLLVSIAAKIAIIQHPRGFTIRFIKRINIY